MNIYYIGAKPLIPYSNAKCGTIYGCYEYLKDKKVLGLDIETTQKFGGKYKMEGLDPYVSEIVMLQIGDEERQYVIDIRTEDITMLLPILMDKNIVKVGHNLKFEYKHIYHKYGIFINNLYDTMIAEQILKNGYGLPMSLKEVWERRFHTKLSKTVTTDFLYIKSRPFLEEEIVYGAKDITAPLAIRKKQLLEIDKFDLDNCIRLEMKFIQVLGDIEYKGMTLDRKAWKDLYVINRRKAEKQKTFLDKFLMSKLGADITKFKDKQLHLFGKNPGLTISWTSPQQVIELFRHLDICPEAISKSTGRLSYTVEATALQEVRSQIRAHIRNDGCELLVQLIDEYLYFKELEQRCSTFGEAFFKHINPITHRIHSNYRQILHTGRISSSGPNLQNIPSSKEFRECFIAPLGFKIINADYSGQEQIILANKSLEPELINFYEEGKNDMHSYIAQKLFLHLEQVSLENIKNNFPQERQLAKGAGFAINYGGNGHTIAKNLGVTQELGDRLYNDYFKAFPKLKDYAKKVKTDAIRKGYILIDRITNRKYFLSSKDKGDIGKIGRLALNFPIQGEAGSITKLAAILFREKLLSVYPSYYYMKLIYMTNIIHDEINVECTVDNPAITTVPIHLANCMRKAADIWCKTVPMKVEAKVSDHWTH